MNGFYSLLYNAIGTMIYYMLHLHKTHVSYNKIQRQYGINPRREDYAILYAFEIKEMDVSPN
jgi:hypothetical protein